MGTRDDMCGMDVAKMEELGGFAEEITIIGCAYKTDKDIFYRVSDNPDEVYLFYKNAATNGLLPTLPQFYVRRDIIPAGQRERMTIEAKLACVRQMRRDFDARFWQYFDVLAEFDAEKRLTVLFERQQQALEGRYNREALELFAVFLNDALKRRHLTAMEHRYFVSWLEENYEKMADDWMIKERYERTFYGFAYYTASTALSYQIDTMPLQLLLKQQDLRLRDFKVTPIFKKTCQYKENAALPRVRQQFAEWLKDVVEKWAVPYEQAVDSLGLLQMPFDCADIDNLSTPAQKTLHGVLRLWGMQ